MSKYKEDQQLHLIAYALNHSVSTSYAVADLEILAVV